MGHIPPSGSSQYHVGYAADPKRFSMPKVAAAHGQQLGHIGSGTPILLMTIQIALVMHAAMYTHRV